jgi:hypothetical protein
MSDTTAEVLAGRKRRGPQPRRRIDLPDGDYLEPRTEFADSIGVHDRTAARMNLPTTYVGAIAYVQHDASLRLLAAGIRQDRPPALKQRRRPHR